jgi:hypothetical protein
MKYDKIQPNNEPTERDMQEIVHSLKFANELVNRFYSEIGKSLTNITKNLMAQFFENIRPSLETLLTESTKKIASALEPLTEIVETIRNDSEIIAPYLQKSKLWISPSMPLEIFSQLRELVKNNDPPPEDVEKVFIEHYEANGWQPLRDLVDYWEDHPHFGKRMKIIRDALDAHIAGKYTLSIPALLPQIEGILSSLTRTPAGKPTKTFKSEIEKRYDDVIPSLSKDILLSLVTSPILYGSTGKNSQFFTPEKFPDWLAQEGLTINQVFNRHAILHGVQIEYESKINSLKTFLLLDVICNLELTKE